MGTIECSKCGKQMASNAYTCPHCGADNKELVSQIFFYTAIIIAVFLLDKFVLHIYF